MLLLKEMDYLSKDKRGNVWLGAAGLVLNNKGEWLVVKKRYGGLEGRWSLPGGFVNGDETIEQAAVREVKEETAVDCTVKNMIGFRSGVLQGKISDNMAIFLLKPIEEEPIIQVQLSELYEAKWILPSDLLEDENASVMLHELAAASLEIGFPTIEGINPGDIFGYTSYKLFIK